MGLERERQRGASGSRSSRAEWGPQLGLAAVLKSLDARFTLDVADLGIVASSLGGTLQASGRLSGPATALSTDAR